MDDEQLLEFDPEQAQQQLNDDQLERYNKLKEEQLQGGIEDKKTEDAESVVDGLSALRESVENEMTVSVRGIEFKGDVNASQIKRLSSFSKYRDKTEEELTPEQVENITENILGVLSDLSIDYDRSDWEESFGDAGVITLSTLTLELVQEIETFMQQKKSR